MHTITMDIREYAAQVAVNINKIGKKVSMLEIPAGHSDRYRISWALLRLAMDHGASITSNLHHHGPDLAGSAFALLRPMNEAFKRGTWFGLCATDKHTERFIQYDEVPSQRKLTEDIEKIPPFDRFPMFTGVFNNAWEKFHSFTHGGVQAVGAYTRGGSIGASFHEEHLHAALDHVEAVYVTAGHVMCMICGEFDPDLAQRVLSSIEDITPTRRRDSRA